MTPVQAVARATGTRYEELVRAHLERAGLAFVARNVQCRYGEIDLVMLDGATVVFVEVRYRRGNAFGDGIDSVGAAKRARLGKAAAMYLAGEPRLAQRACRFDVVAVSGAADAPSFDWCRNAFDVF